MQESRILQDFNDWEAQLKSYDKSNLEETVDVWVEKAFSYIPEETKVKFFQQLDTWLFHLQGLIHESSFQQQAQNRIVKTSQIFDPSISTIEDIQSLPLEHKSFIANQQIAKQKLYGIIQGGMTGTGKFSTLAIDVPAFTLLNLRTTQLIAMSYGYRTDSPVEIIKLLQVFYVATLPKRFQYNQWVQLKEDATNSEYDPYFYPQTERDRSDVWIHHPLAHICKLIFILAVSRNQKKLPIVGVVTGASLNHYWTKQVSTFAHNFFLVRHTTEK